MKITIRTIVFAVSVFVFSKVSAQLANWTPGQNPANTDFPAFASDQINGSCRISQMKFHATNPDILYAVTGQGGFFRTSDGGLNWNVVAGTENITSSCASLCVDYTNDQVIYLGTGDANYYSNGEGVLKSTNGGVSFTATTLTNCLVVEILQDPLNSAVFVAATNKGIYKSLNNGATWTAQTATNIEFCDMQMKANATTRTLYAATRENTARFFRSTDFGVTWTQISNGIITAVANIQAGARIGVTPADSNVVYFAAIGGLGIIHKSIDNGSTFTVQKPENVQNLTGYDNSIASGGGQGNYNNCIAVDRLDPAKLWYQSHNTWRSTNNGVTWTFLHHWPSGIHTDAHQIIQSPFDSSKLYAVNDGGVWLSTNEGTTWTPISDGLYAYEVGSGTLASSHTNKDLFVIGTQDNGKIYRDASGFVTVQGGDDYERKEFDYLPNGGYYYNLNGTSRTPAPGSRTYLQYGLPSNISSVEAIAFNRINPEVGFVGKYNVYRTSNLSSTTPSWVVISSFSTPIMAIHSCIADINKLYVITNDQKLYVSSNAMSGAPTFTQYSLPTASNSLASVVAIANDANKVYISINASVYMSSNGGASWTNITYNLPNVNHRRILAEEYGGTQELVFIATNNAVYYKKAGQVVWTNYGTGLPSRRAPTGFSMFDNGTNQSVIRFSSYGRGVWETRFDNLRPYSAQIALNNDSIITCAQPAVQFTSGTIGGTNTPLSYVWSFPGGVPSSSTLETQDVVYPNTGTYSVTLTVTDALNNISSKTISKYIQVISCDPDTIPGSAISIAGSNNYMSTPALPLGTTNTITLSAWIKIPSTQSANAGIIFTNSGSATGLNFKSGNQIGYHYNDLSSTYGYSGGPVIPMNQWVHVALVTTATNSTIYVNGVAYVNNFANSPVNFSNGFTIGNDRGNTSRTMNGLIDEVCIYNRSLSQSEIRELMHLTRNHTSIDPNLKAYYQCNETGSVVFDRAGSKNGTLLGTATHALSSAPVGSGNSERQTITTNGLKTFANEGISLTFGAGTLPNGEICVTRLNLQPDALPQGVVSTNAAGKYWIINNYGSNSTFTSLVNFTATGYGNISAPEASTPNIFKLYRRGTGAFDFSSWSLLDSASTATSGINGVLTFTGTSNNAFSRQFTIGKSVVPPTYAITASSGANGSITPAGVTNVLAGGSITYTIVGNSCFQIANVIVDGVSLGAVSSYTFTNVIAPHTISATFISNYNITASAGANGLVLPLGVTTVACGASQTYNIVPNFCNQVTSVTVDGVSVGAVSSYTFNNVNAPHTIAATFSPIVPCNTDTIPGSAMSVNGSNNYGVTPDLPLGTTNTVTFSAWIKIETTQPTGAGVIFTSSGGACGLNFKSGNQLGYHFRDQSGTYGFNGGPFVPLGQWVHVALVITPTNGTIYMNGVPYTNTFANSTTNFNGEFFIGNDRGNTSRTMTGMIDEVCIYNRSLSQNEIRELMHLTRNNTTIDPNLKAYYQFNETGGVIYDRVGTSHGSLLGTSSHVLSTAPVGKGVSQRQTITTNGLKTFATAGVTLNFGAGTLPDGEICVTRLNIQPDSVPGNLFANAASKYWIINNYGVNSSFSALNDITVVGYGNITAPEASQPSQFRIYSRGTGEFRNNVWSGIQNATSAVAGSNGTLGFAGANSNEFNKQFTVVKNIAYAIAGNSPSFCLGGNTVIGGANDPNLAYAWSPSTGLSSSSVSNPTASPSATTNYTLTTTNAITNTTATSSVLVRVIPSNLTAAAITSAPVSGQVCEGDSATMTASGGVLPAFVALGSGTSTTTGNSTGSALGPNPLQNFYGGSKQLMLFTASELNALGLNSGAKISGFSVNLAAANTAYVLQNLYIKVQHTGLTSLTGFVGSGWTTVRNAANFTIASTGWNAIPFNTNFTWNGSSNLLVEISFSNNNTGSSGNTAFFGSTSNVSTLMYRVDNVNAATIEAYLGAPTYSYSARNNVRFSLANQSTTYDWTPSSGLNTTSGATVVSTPSATTNYIVAAAVTGSCPQTAAMAIAIPTHDVTASAGTNGSITPIGTSTVNCGSNLSYTITPNACYEIASVLVDGVNNSAAVSSGTYTFTNITDAHTISATFSQITYSITATSGTNGIISPSGVASVNCGSNQTYTITPNPGYVVQDVLINGVSQGSISNYTFINVVSTNSISVTFVASGSNVWYLDADGDTYGNAAVSVIAGAAPVGYVADNTDCCDSNAEINPTTEWWADIDNDGVGSFIFQTGCDGGITCNSSSWTPQTIPYCQLIHSGIPYAIDCNDNNNTVYPGAIEICANSIDNNCNGQIDEGCSAPANDSPANAVIVQYSSNMNYPNCYMINGSTFGCADSPESIYSGPDMWYRFVAQSTAVSITMTSTTMDDAIALYFKSGNSYVLVDYENAAIGTNDFERLNRGGLIPGTTYYVSVGSAVNATGGSFQMCIQNLMPSGCAYAVPSLGFSFCFNYKAVYRSASSYVFNFTGTGGNAFFPYTTTSATSMSGLQNLGTASLDLRHGGIYQVRVDANYGLTNGTGANENITVFGSPTSANCTGVVISAQPLVEVKPTLQCPVILSRASYLIGTAVSGNSTTCGAISYTFELTPVLSCADNSVAGASVEYTTTSGSPYLALGVLPAGTSTSTWRVRIRPNFNFGSGVYGPASIIKVSGVAASLMTEAQPEYELKFDVTDEINLTYYPNPMHGDVINLSMNQLPSELVAVKIVDNLGRLIYNNSFITDGSLNTTIVFDHALASDVYFIECVSGHQVVREKIVVVK